MKTGIDMGLSTAYENIRGSTGRAWSWIRCCLGPPVSAVMPRGRWLALPLSLLAACPAPAQVSQAWVARYNGGFTNGTHQAWALALDGTGNLVIGGSSQNATNGYDYVVLKYSAGGQPIWASRYTPGLGNGSLVTGLALDPTGNIYLTGNGGSGSYYFPVGLGGTIKLGPDGTRLWSANYSGNSLAVDTNGNVFLAANYTFAAIKLDTHGNLVYNSNFTWLWTYPEKSSQNIALDPAGNVYVNGWAVSFYSPQGSTAWPVLVEYNGQGDQVWFCKYGGSFTMGEPYQEVTWSPGGLAVASNGTAYAVFNMYQSWWAAVLANQQGTSVVSYAQSTGDGRTGIAVDRAGNLLTTGYGGQGILTFKSGSGGSTIWSQTYPAPQLGSRPVISIALDAAGNSYVAAANAIGEVNVSGVALGGITWITLAYSPNGVPLWTNQFTGPVTNDVPSAILSAPDGSLYVAGCSGNTSGGFDLTVVKYVPFSPVSAGPGGRIVVRSAGNPGRTNYLSASTDLQNWTPIAAVPPDTNNICQFTDTNAPALPARYYRWHQ